MILPPHYKPNWVEGLPDETYHADTDFVSSSGLRALYSKSPRDFQQRYLLGRAEKPTKDMIFGRLLHQVVLDGAHFLKTYVVMPSFDQWGHYNTKVHKQKKAEWLAEHAHQVVVTQDKFDDLRYMIDSVLEHKDAFALLADGTPEVSGYYRDPATGIACRIRPDFLAPALGAVVDLKSTKDVEQNSFSRTIADFRYDIQMAMYTEGTNLIEGGPKFDMQAIIAVEKTKPYDTAVYVLDNAATEIGLRDYRRALEVYAECHRTGEFPRYQPNMQPIGLPYYMLTRDYERPLSNGY